MATWQLIPKGLAASPPRRALTFVQLENGVGHGRQHPLSFQDVDVPEPQGEGEGRLFQTQTNPAR